MTRRAILLFAAPAVVAMMLLWLLAATSARLWVVTAQAEPVVVGSGGSAPTGETLVSAQTAGCRVVVDAGRTTLGFADPGPVDQLLSTTS
jgi:hypothetical protein